MKKVLCVVYIFLLVCGNVFSLSLGELAPEAKVEFNKKALSINTSANTEIGVVPIGNTGVSVGSGSTNTDWYPFVGNTPVSKEDFFRIAGYDEEAERYNATMKKNRNIITAEWVALIGGLIGTIGGLIIADQAYPSMWGGVTLAGVSFITMCSPLVINDFEIDESKMFSVSFAVRIANDYNQRLLESLM